MPCISLPIPPLPWPALVSHPLSALVIPALSVPSLAQVACMLLSHVSISGCSSGVLCENIAYIYIVYVI